MTVDAIAAIESHPKLASGQNLIVGLSGIDGSGKSTYGAQLLKSLRSRDQAASLVSLDDFLRPKAIRHANPDQISGYFWENFDFEALANRVLIPIRDCVNVSTELQVLDLESDRLLTRPFEFNGPGILIVEGVFLFRKEYRPYFDVKIWIDVSFETALSRVLYRQRDQRYGDTNAIQRRYEERFFPTQRFHLKRDDPIGAADFIISNP